MREQQQNAWLAGVDGCAGGWIAAFVRPQGDEVRVRIVPRFADVLGAPEQPAVVAVDMPIGLPDRVGAGGRAAENASGRCSAPASRRCSRCRRARRSMPRDYGEACRIAQATSEPPRKVSKQLFNIAPKIREVDAGACAWTRTPPAACSRCIPSWRSGGSTAATRADRTEEGQEPPLRARSRAAPGFADRRRASRRCGERVAAQRCGGRRPARCAGLRRHRAADLSPVSPAVSRTRRRAMRLDWRWPSGHEVC